MNNQMKDNAIAFSALAIMSSPFILIWLFFANAKPDYEATKLENLQRASVQADEEICNRSLDADLCRKARESRRDFNNR
jgi:hypothetical protein